MGSTLAKEIGYYLKTKGCTLQAPLPQNPNIQPISGPPLDWVTHLVTSEQTLQLLSRCRSKIKKDALLTINEFLMKINFGLVVGNFEIDFRDGELLLRSSVVHSGTSVPGKLFESMFERHVVTLREYGDQLTKAVEMPITPNVHFGVKCDACGTMPIIGTRYKCKECKDYDLCHQCKEKKVHTHHPFVKYLTPSSEPVSEGDQKGDKEGKEKGTDNNGKDSAGSSGPSDLVAEMLKLLLQQNRGSPNVNNAGETPPVNPSNIKPTSPPQSPQAKVVSSNQIQFVKSGDGKKVKLGKGGFATVFKAKWLGLEVAVKVINENLPPDVKELFSREVSAMAALHHPHIVLMLGLCEEPPSIIMPLMAKGSLQDIINNENKSPTPLSLKLKYIIDAAKGMAFVHGNYILHGDLKPLNILVDKNDVGYIADFGLAKIKASTTAMAAGSAVLAHTLLYASPEVLRHGKLTPESDVYSFGILIWAVITCRTPFQGTFSNTKDFEIKVENGLRPDASFYPPKTPQALKDLAAECWHMVPSKRPDFLTIIDKLEALL